MIWVSSHPRRIRRSRPQGASWDQERRVLLELLDDRYDKRSTVFTSQFPTDVWYENLADPTLADAILDRILHNAYRLELAGESLRKSRRKLTGVGGSGA